jgi:endo-1,4-beta-xylanase
MKKTTFFRAGLFFVFTLFFLFSAIQYSGSQTLCTHAGTDQFIGEKDGYYYELWNQNSQGTACMTLGDGARFSGEWINIENYLARRGLGYDQTKEHQETGTFYATYNCNYKPTTASGNSYLSIYGWTVDPLIEYYIVEDWRNWIPSMDENAVLKGTIEVNGSIYDILESTRVNQPSIVGNTTFQQYFSIRRDVRNSGTINISDHFKAWEALGMNLGKLHEVSFVVEGYKSNGSFEFIELDVFINDGPLPEASGCTSNEMIYSQPN